MYLSNVSFLFLEYTVIYHTLALRKSSWISTILFSFLTYASITVRCFFILDNTYSMPPVER